MHRFVIRSLMVPMAMAALLCFGRAEAGPVLQFASAGSGVTGQDLSLGFAFTTNEAVLVVALDNVDPAFGGEVRLYDGLGNVLASAHVTLLDPLEGVSPVVHSHAIAPVLLAGGQTYYITADLPTGSGAFINATGITSDPAITYLHPVADVIGTNPFVDLTGGAYGNAFFGPNFDVQAVPEPASILTLTFGALGLAGYGWRRRKLATLTNA